MRKLEPTKDELLALVNKNGLLIEYVQAKHRTPSLCYAAVRSNVRAIKFLKNEEITPEILELTEGRTIY